MVLLVDDLLLGHEVLDHLFDPAALVQEVDGVLCVANEVVLALAHRVLHREVLKHVLEREQRVPHLRGHVARKRQLGLPPVQEESSWECEVQDDPSEGKVVGQEKGELAQVPEASRQEELDYFHEEPVHQEEEAKHYH